MRQFNQYIQDFFSLLFPDLCNACGVQLVQGEKLICIHCLHDLPYTDFHIYPQNAVARLFWGRVPCHAAMALLYFRKATKVQQLIHRLKYRSQPQLGFLLGSILGQRLLLSETYSGVDLILPVPLHPKKKRSRGYNQSEAIADGIASMLNVPVGTTQLIRPVVTSTQTKKNRYKRFENMQSVFQSADPAQLKGKHILLVDDVITTGATLEACAAVVLKGGPSKLSIAALAFAE